MSDTLYLLAESGSTKTSWCVFGSQGAVQTFHTEGINPNILTWSQIDTYLNQAVLPQLTGTSIQGGIFYGAGFSNPAYCQRMGTLLQQCLHLPQALARHDLLAAARAASQGEDALVCILGTGSNSCLYRNGAIVQTRGGHGYIFGDHGSGVDLGRRAIQLLLDGDLPPDLSASLLVHTGHATALDLRDSIYAAPKPNAAMAELAFWVEKNMDRTEIEQLILASFDAFLLNTVTRYAAADRLLPVHFVGSVASVFWPLLRQRVQHHGLIPGRLTPKPLDALIAFHQTHGI